MTSDPHTRAFTALGTPPVGPAAPQPSRLRLKPKALPTDLLDGGWWPRSRDLATELPALAEALAARVGHVTQVALATAAWRAFPPRIVIDGHDVLLARSHLDDEHLMRVFGQQRRRVSLLVVPPEAAETAGHMALILAAQRTNADRPTQILVASGALPATGSQPRTSPDDAVGRWMADGG